MKTTLIAALAILATVGAANASDVGMARGLGVLTGVMAECGQHVEIADPVLKRIYDISLDKDLLMGMDDAELEAEYAGGREVGEFVTAARAKLGTTNATWDKHEQLICKVVTVEYTGFLIKGAK